MNLKKVFQRDRMEKLNFIDISKAIGIILVVVGHYYPDNAPIYYDSFRSYIYTFHMPLFLFLSGCMFAYTRKKESVVLTMKKKLNRLAIPYIIVSVLIIGLKLVTQRFVYVENGVDFFSFVRMLYEPEAGYFLWYIWVLLWMYFLCSFFNNRAYLYILFVLSIIVKFIPEEFPRVLCLHELKNSAMYFLFGAILFNDNIYVHFRKNHVQMLFVICFVICSFFWFMGWYQSPIVMSLFGTLGIYSLANMMDKGEYKKLLYIGKSSFIIYLFHTTIMGFVKSVIHKFSETMFVENDVYFMISVIVVAFSGIYFSLLLQEYIKKNHVIGPLFGFKRN